MMKLQNIDNVAEWFGSLGIPLPLTNVYLAETFGILGAVLLFVGTAIKIISIPLIFVMLIVFFSVHLGNSFEAGNNGFEIPLYYLIMLFTLLIYGSGKISLKYLTRHATLARLL